MAPPSSQRFVWLKGGLVVPVEPVLLVLDLEAKGFRLVARRRRRLGPSGLATRRRRPREPEALEAARPGAAGLRAAGGAVMGRGKSRANERLIGVAREILADIQPASVRAVCYQLFTRKLIASMAKNDTNRVSSNCGTRAKPA